MARIAVFIPSLVPGGAERVALFMVESLAQAGHQVTLLVAAAHGRFLNHPTARRHMLALGAAHEMAALPAYLRYLRRARPELVISLVHSANLQAAIGSRLVPGVPHIASIHSSLERPGVEQWWLRRWLGFAPERRLHAGAAAVHVVCREMADQVAERWRIPRERIAVIPNPVAPEDDGAVAPEHARWRDPPPLVWAGQFRRAKNLPLLLAAFADARRERPGARLLLLGDGLERRAVEAEAKRLGLAAPALRLAGYVPSIAPYLRRAVGFVLSSDYEGFSLVLAEAVAAGVPILATDCRCGPAEVLDHGRFGRLVPVGNRTALARGMIDLLDGRIAVAPAPARREWVSRFHPEAVARAYGALVDAVLGGRAVQADGG